MFKSKTKTKTGKFGLETTRDQDHGLEDNNTVSICAQDYSGEATTHWNGKGGREEEKDGELPGRERSAGELRAHQCKGLPLI